MSQVRVSPRRRSVTGLVFTLLFGLPLAGAAAEEADAPLFASVNGEKILLQTYVQELRNAAKNRFYHGQAPENEVEVFQREAGQELLDVTLMLQESRRLGLEPDREWVESELKRLEARYSAHPDWHDQKEAVVEDLRRRLEAKNLLAQLKRRVEAVGEPTPDQQRDYYERNPDKFTSPEQVRVSMILLKVEPWAPSEQWESALAQAGQLVFQIREGAAFEELAEAWSQDPSADQGGDMGYLHRGMLGGPTQEVLDQLKSGEMSDAFRILEGVVIVRLEDRREPVLNSFDSVQSRVVDLWKREERVNAMERLIAELRQNAEIEYHDAHYIRLLEEATLRGEEIVEARERS